MPNVRSVSQSLPREQFALEIAAIISIIKRRTSNFETSSVKAPLTSLVAPADLLIWPPDMVAAGMWGAIGMKLLHILAG